MEISEIVYEMSKPNNEKYIILFKYFCSLIGLRFNLKKTFQQKDSACIPLMAKYILLVLAILSRRFEKGEMGGGGL